MTMLSKTTFAQQIRQALENLHDPVFMQNLALVRQLSRQGQTVDQCVRRLRSDLLDMIDSFLPAATLPPRSKERRPYLLLYGRYVQGMTTGELVEELSISVRQLRREHKRALTALIDRMWERMGEHLQDDLPSTPPTVQEQRTVPATSQRREAAVVETAQLISQSRKEDLELAAMIDDLQRLLIPVAARHGTLIECKLPNALPTVRADRIVLRQALLQVLSFALDRASTGVVTISAEEECKPVVHLRVCATGKESSNMRTGVSLEISRQLISSAGGEVEIIDTPEMWSAHISLPVAEASTLLVIDDNAGLIALFERYLSARPYQLISVTTAEEAIEAATLYDPKMILLDIMMPKQDGWELLQTLVAAPISRAIPVVICSVVNEPEIAAALGAADYLTKPVTQDALLTMLERWCNALPAQVQSSPIAP